MKQACLTNLYKVITGRLRQCSQLDCEYCHRLGPSSEGRMHHQDRADSAYQAWSGLRLTYFVERTICQDANLSSSFLQNY